MGLEIPDKREQVLFFPTHDFVLIAQKRERNIPIAPRTKHQNVSVTPTSSKPTNPVVVLDDSEKPATHSTKPVIILFQPFELRRVVPVVNLIRRPPNR